MKIRVVLDTNIFISALFWKGNPNEILKKCYRGELQLLVSGDMLNEVEGILVREKKFELTRGEIAEHLEIIKLNSELLEPKIKINVIKEDLEDNKFLECAVTGKADYIVSGDRHLLNLKKFRGIKILSSLEFLRIIKRA